MTTPSQAGDVKTSAPQLSFGGGQSRVTLQCGQPQGLWLTALLCGRQSSSAHDRCTSATGRRCNRPWDMSRVCNPVPGGDCSTSPPIAGTLPVPCQRRANHPKSTKFRGTEVLSRMARPGVSPVFSIIDGALNQGVSRHDPKAWSEDEGERRAAVDGVTCVSCLGILLWECLHSFRRAAHWAGYSVRPSKSQRLGDHVPQLWILY